MPTMTTESHVPSAPKTSSLRRGSVRTAEAISLGRVPRGSVLGDTLDPLVSDDHRRRLLAITLGFQPREPGYGLELRRYDGQGSRAMFFHEGFEHSKTSHEGAGWALSPWAAMQQAAADSLKQLESGQPARRDWTLKDESPALSAVGRLSGMLAAPAPADTNDDTAEAAREEAIENRMLQPTNSP